LIGALASLQTWTVVPRARLGAALIGAIAIAGCGGGVGQATGGAGGTGGGTDAGGAGGGGGAGGAVTADVTVSVDPGTQHQTMVGFGASLVYYADYVSNRQVANDDIYQVLFVDLGLDLLRIANWYQNQTETGTSVSTPFSDSAAVTVVANATAALGHPPRILMSSWTPPAYLKSNGDTKGGGTLLRGPANGLFDYSGFADWWVRSLEAYAAMGVAPDYVSIQNEPELSTNYESCLLDAVASGNAGYPDALDAVHGALAASSLAKLPALVGPESLGLGGSGFDSYVSALDASELGAIAHHLYSGGASGDDPAADSFAGVMSAAASTGAAAGKPLFMTEFAPNLPTMIDTALLIHEALTVEQVSVYLYWALAWAPGSPVNWLVTVENPAGPFTTPKGYTINDPYYGLKHYARWIDEGWIRVDAASSAPGVKASAFLSPDGGGGLTVVMINADGVTHQVAFTLGSFATATVTAFRSSGTAERTSAVMLADGNIVEMPPQSIVTLSLTSLIH
jgi:glucuronoarabinoxylan endo-1,4-beta-xylanase